MAKQKKATAKDARLILELYDLRREAEMRKARIVNVTVERGAALDAAIAAARAMAERAGSPKAFRKRATWQLSGLPLPYAMSVVREQALAR